MSGRRDSRRRALRTPRPPKLLTPLSSLCRTPTQSPDVGRATSAESFIRPGLAVGVWNPVSRLTLHSDMPVQHGCGRGLAKGNTREQNRRRTLGRERLQNELGRIRQVAATDKEPEFTALWHHVYDKDRLKECYYGLKRNSAKGVDGETWKHYGENLEANIHDLSARLKRGAYHAKPVRRVYIPKPDGRQRPIGVPALEDKIVQSAVAEVLQAVYEADFKDCSYGFSAAVYCSMLLSPYPANSGHFR